MKTTIKIYASFFLGVCFLWGWSTASTTGSFLTTLSNQKESVLSLYDSGYVRIYNQFQLTGAAIMKSPTYQSLVCLGVMNNGSFLKDMQNDLKTLKIDFLNKYNTILASFLELEQKRDIYNDSKVNLFSYGSYDKDLIALSGLYTQLLAQQNIHVVDFQKKYSQAISNFIRDYISYSKKNMDLISQVSSKILLLEQVDTNFGILKSTLDYHILNLATLSKSQLFANSDNIKRGVISLIDQTLHKQLLTQTKRYPILKSLSGELSTEKDLLMSGFSAYFDSSYNNFLGNRYPIGSYNKLQSKIQTIQGIYYSGSVYQCSSILANKSFDLDIALLLKELKQFSGSLSSGLNTSSFAITGFEKKLNSWFSDIQAKQSALISQYKNFTQTTIKKLLEDHRKLALSSQELPSLLLSTGSALDTVDSSGFISPIGFLFKQPFTTNQKHPDIIVLKGLLSSLGYYTGNIDNVYTSLTKSAVHRFQLDKGLLKGYEKKPQTWGWMGPATRSALNTLLH